MSQNNDEKKAADDAGGVKKDTPSTFSIPVVELEGVAIPQIFESNRPMKEHVQLLKELEIRDDDVMVMASAKSGTHWIWEVVSMLTAGKAEYEKRNKELAMMEATAVEKLRAQPSPRVLNSHLPFRLLPRQLREKRTKVIHVYRNVKDVFVSMYFHFRQIPGGEAMSLEDFEKLFFSKSLPTGNYFSYLREMHEYRQNNPDHPMFLMCFEDTKEDAAKVAKRLADFLGVKASPQLCQDIAQATVFKKLKKAEESKEQLDLAPINFYRKGEVGDWKNHLTVAQSERFDVAIKDLESRDYKFRYTL